MSLPFDIEQVVRSYVSLDSLPTSKGWYPVLCQVCNDHGKKGDRGGFKFENNGVGYHCFNCGHTAKFDPDESKSVSPNMRTVFESFGIPDDEWQQLELMVIERSLERTEISSNTPESKPRVSIEPSVLTVPTHFKKLSKFDSEDTWRIIAEDYISYERQLDPSAYPYYLSTGKSDIKAEYAHKWLGRLIIPIYNRRGELIYYQGRSLINHEKKYMSPNDGKTKVMYGFDQIYTRTDAPLFVVEGFFDAVSIGNSCATLGNKLSEEMITHLNRSSRPKIIVPDMYGNGAAMGWQALEQGWSISIPDIPGCKDLNDAVKKYGKMYTIKTLMDNVCEGEHAKVMLNLFVE